MGENLSDDAMEEIITRLPWREFIRCKILSKKWLTRINSAKSVAYFFQKNPLKTAQLLLASPSDPVVATADVSPQTATSTRWPYPATPVNIWSKSCKKIAGAAQGIVLLVLNHDEEMYLGNPYTEELRPVPYPRRPLFGCDVNFMHGLVEGGERNLDLKVILISYELGCLGRPNVDRAASKIEVYSLSNELWKICGPSTLSQSPRNKDACTILKGSIIYIYGWWNLNLVPELQAFNVDDESTTVIPHPLGLTQYRLAECFLSSEGDLLSLIHPNPSNASQCSMEFWIMKEYGNQSSWIKVVTPTNLYPVTSSLWIQPIYYRDEKSWILVVDELMAVEILDLERGIHSPAICPGFLTSTPRMCVYNESVRKLR